MTNASGKAHRRPAGRLAALCLLGLLLASCAPTPSPPPPTTSPIDLLLGTPLLPTAATAPTLVVALAPTTSSAAQNSSAAVMAQQLSALTGLPVQTVVPPSYRILIESLGEGTVHVAWLPPFAYVLAHDQTYAEAALASVRFGSHHRGIQFIAHAAQSYAAAAGPNDLSVLQQFEGKTPCWTEPNSSSGYVIPLGLLNNQNITVQDGPFLRSNPAVVRAVYNSPGGETCDFGATFIDARLSVTNLPDVNDNVVVVYRTAPIIPHDIVAYATALTPEIRSALTAALLQISASETGKKALKDIYQVDGLVPIDDTFFDDFRFYLERSGLDLAGLVE